MLLEAGGLLGVSRKLYVSFYNNRHILGSRRSGGSIRYPQPLPYAIRGLGELRAPLCGDPRAPTTFLQHSADHVTVVVVRYGDAREL